MRRSTRGEGSAKGRPRAVRQVALALSCALALGGAALSDDARASAQELTDAEIVAHFGTIALRSEYQRNAEGRVVRWNGPIHIYVEQNVDIEAVVEQDLRRHMARLSRLTGIPMTYVDTAGASNFHIVYTRLDRFPHYIRQFTSAGDAGLRILLQRADCVGFFNARRSTGEIIRAAAVIPVDHARERGILYACTVEETTQVMGLPNDSDEVVPSIFNDSTITEDLTWLDELMLRILYHPSMRPGTSREAALNLARQLVPQLRR